MIDDTMRRVDSNLNASIHRLQEFLNIPSIGSEAAYIDDMNRAAAWLVGQLREMGFEADLRDSGNCPIVVSHYREGHSAAPTVLYYGNYDVSSAAPIAHWTSPPFESAIVEGPTGKRLIARGAADGKGQIMTWIEAFRAYLAEHGNLPFPIKILIEGRKEQLSPCLDSFLSLHQAELASDVCIVSDCTMLAPDRPAINIRSTGAIYFEVALSGAAHDLDFRLYGGAIVNPANALARLIADLHNDLGQVTLPDFYENVLEVSKTEREQWDAIGFDAHAWLSKVGQRESMGEADFSVLERLWARPALDINGIWGGHMGEGPKAIIPRSAYAKLSARLVPNQNPDEILRSICNYFEENCPKGCKVEIREQSGRSGYRAPERTKFVEAASRAAVRVFGRLPAMVGSANSIPAAALLKDRLGVETVRFGFALDDDRTHGSDECFELVRFERGIKTHVALLYEMSS